jgi:hypothetical protein
VRAYLALHGGGVLARLGDVLDLKCGVFLLLQQEDGLEDVVQLQLQQPVLFVHLLLH